jgi:type II secretory pathway predicted ATPase ExeA
VNKPYPYRDFVRVQKLIESALLENADPYILILGETGTGKTALLRQTKAALDRSRFKICYFSEACRLGAPGLVRVVSEALRVRASMNHSLTFDRLLRTLVDESAKLLLWFDEAHDLPRETLGEARALIESDLDGASRIQVVFAGLPRLAADLKQQPHLWRRVSIREELLGIARDEMADFVTHHFGAAATKRLCEKGQETIFENGKGSPGLLLPILRRIFVGASGKAAIDLEHITESVARWNVE